MRLYEKYRPARWKDAVGNTRQGDYVKNTGSSNETSHERTHHEASQHD